MANIDNKNLLVWVKSMSRGQALPLDSSEVHESLDAAKSYAASAVAYGGQTIKAKLEDGKYHEYILQPSEAGYTLEEVGGTSPSNLKQYVMIVETLPESGQEQGILYICDGKGYIYNGSNWKPVFTEVSEVVDILEERIGGIPTNTTLKQYIDNAIGSGGTSSAEAIAVAKQEAIDVSKAYTDAQIASALTIIEF